MQAKIRRIRNAVRRRIRHRRDFADDGMPARVDFEPDGARVHIGAQNFFIRAHGIEAPRHTVADFALFGLAIISMSANVEVRVKDPVSRSGAEAMSRLKRAISLWAMPKTYELRMEFETVVDDPRPSNATDRILCVSGGIDSTSAAVAAAEAGSMTHGLLIAGADYPSAENPGFVELRDRVENIMQTLGLQLVVVETDIKRLPFNWEMLHSLNLAMCLNYLSPNFISGGIAMDNTPQQDLARHPWGNSSALCDAMSLGYFPVSPLADDMDRVEKIAAIAKRDPALLRQVSVCWEDRTQGGNCGHCIKCTQTRLAFICADVPEEVAFPTDHQLEDCIARWPIAARPTALRGTNVRVEELVWHLPDGPLKDRLLTYREKIQKRLRQYSIPR